MIIHAEIVFSPQLTLGNLYFPSGMFGDAQFHKIYCWKAKNLTIITSISAKKDSHNFKYYLPSAHQLQLLIYFSHPGGEFKCMF